MFALFADDVAIATLVIWGLPALGVSLPVGAVIGIISGIAARNIITHHLVRKVLLKKAKTGFDDMSGHVGRLLQPIEPEGLVKINNEVWKARYSNDRTSSRRVTGEVVVVGRRGLTLYVRNREVPRDERIENCSMRGM